MHRDAHYVDHKGRKSFPVHELPRSVCWEWFTIIFISIWGAPKLCFWEIIISLDRGTYTYMFLASPSMRQISRVLATHMNSIEISVYPYDSSTQSSLKNYGGGMETGATPLSIVNAEAYKNQRNYFINRKRKPRYKTAKRLRWWNMSVAKITDQISSITCCKKLQGFKECNGSFLKSKLQQILALSLKFHRPDLSSLKVSSGDFFSREKEFVRHSCWWHIASAMICEIAPERHSGRQPSYILFQLYLIREKIGVRVISKARQKRVQLSLSFSP